jgi:hypothetical protein
MQEVHKFRALAVNPWQRDRSAPASNDPVMGHRSPETEVVHDNIAS